MNTEVKIVDHELAFCKANFSEQDDWKEAPPTSRQIRKRIFAEIKTILSSLNEDNTPFAQIERRLIFQVFTLGRLLIAFFLALRQERSSPAIRIFRRKGFQKRCPQQKMLGTFFGKVRFWRTYMKGDKANGVYPLDLSLGLTTDGFSMTVLSLAAKLATFVSFDRVTEVFLDFLLWSPSKTSVEHTVLGLGKHTADWFAQAPPPKDDGEVLVIQIDSKATPTATDRELEKRRGKRQPNPFPNSPRHRGRHKRGRRGSKARRKKGDKAKNGKAATLVVMYTLKREVNGDGTFFLRGPINKKVYASYLPKRHAFEFARREADKRGFAKGSWKTIQIVTDGDLDFEDYIKEFFPNALPTLDVMHVIERLWEAGACFYPEGSKELAQWMEKMKKIVYGGNAQKVIRELSSRLAKIPKTGPGNKGRRERLKSTLEYLSKRIDRMNYSYLIEEDLELASGAVEGAVRHVIGERFDCGGMRWIKERAEALLKLRCIEINGDWNSFISFVHEKLGDKAKQEFKGQRLLSPMAGSLSGVA